MHLTDMVYSTPSLIWIHSSTSIPICSRSVASQMHEAATAVTAHFEDLVTLLSLSDKPEGPLWTRQENVFSSRNCAAFRSATPRTAATGPR